MDAILFVDDTDLLHLDMAREETVSEAVDTIQESVTNWGKLLIATGGALKPIKCFSYLILIDWDKQGRWAYTNYENVEEAMLRVPMLDGIESTTDSLAYSVVKETLRVCTSLDGSGMASVKKMREKVEKWLKSAAGGNWNQRMFWTSVERQL